MNRRDALSRVALILGGTVVGANVILEGCKPADKKATGDAANFTPDDVAYLDEIAETIIPATDTPGAKAAKVGAFMTVMVKDCYEEKDQKTFRDGMDKISSEARKKFDKSFMELSADERHQLLVVLDNEQKDYGKNKKKDGPNHYFRLMKELTLLGYFTSEIGCNQALRYVETPGKYEGCIPYKKGDKAWAI
ncbi:MAG: gluconate 2-dehydrogenase subunit 3 family protein [Chitinophagaceae bacterium]|nr:MAG: gluconate 2-dehydrogenase subunit 3 family protein [Chitinophagaceae bacterium]